MDKFDRAIQFATAAHAGMTRKANDTPYIVHPLEVAAIAASLTNDEDVLCAAVLHDTVEDTGVELIDLAFLFGDRVAYLVDTETEDKLPGLPKKETWQRRKELSLELLNATDDVDVRILWLSDKLSNMRAYARMHEVQGNDLWNNFNQSDPSRQAWYYRSVLEATRSLAATTAWREYEWLMNTVFEGVE